MQHSLISPSDYKTGFEEEKKEYKLPDDHPPLTDEDTAIAKKDLVKKNYPMVDREYQDPPIKNGNKFCLHSFYPSSGATPDEDGIYGMVKCRGGFKNIEKADEYAEHLVRHVDSMHVIHISKVGHPFPMCDDEKRYAEETNTVEMQQKVTKALKQDLKDRKKQDKDEMMDIKKREKKLVQEGKDAEEGKAEDPWEFYTKSQVKRAQLIWTYKDYEEKMVEIEKILKQTCKDIKEMDADDATYRQKYMDIYMEARNEVSLPDDSSSFVKYMMEDVKLPFEFE